MKIGTSDLVVAGVGYVWYRAFRTRQQIRKNLREILDAVRRVPMAPVPFTQAQIKQAQQPEPFPLVPVALVAYAVYRWK